MLSNGMAFSIALVLIGMGAVVGGFETDGYYCIIIGGVIGTILLITRRGSV